MPSDVDNDTRAGSDGGQSYPAEESGENPKDTARAETSVEPGAVMKKYKELVKYRTFIIQQLQEGNHQAEVIRRLWKVGYAGSKSNAAYYIKDIREEMNITISKSSIVQERKRKPGINIKDKKYTERELMESIWMGKGFSKGEREILSRRHSVLLVTERCVREFKHLFEKKNMPQLYIFIQKYKECSIKMLCSFAQGLERDIEAVENAVASKKSNAFVEGINNRLKMVKRTMFGRCSQKLLSSKMTFQKWSYT